MPTALHRIKKGDPAAIEECLDLYGDMVWRLARRYLDRATAETEDAVQEVFIEIWMSAGRFDPKKGTERAFVATIAHRRLIDYQRRVTTRWHKTREAEPKHATSANPGEALSTVEQSARAGGVLSSLPDGERHALWLWLYRGMTHREISRETGTPIGTVKSRLRRGLMRMNEQLSSDNATAKGGAS